MTATQRRAALEPADHSWKCGDDVWVVGGIYEGLLGTVAEVVIDTATLRTLLRIRLTYGPPVTVRATDCMPVED